MPPRVDTHRMTRATRVDPVVVDEVEVGEDPVYAMVAAQHEAEFRSKLFEHFHRRDPSKFFGVGTPIEAIEFISDMETLFEPMGIESELRVWFTTYRLHEGARDLRGNLRLLLTARGEDPVSWERFIEMFRENYCLSTHVAATERDLILLIQGMRSVDELAESEASGAKRGCQKSDGTSGPFSWRSQRWMV
ncbi:hypothetical protein LIER_22943 [Lithospermum erythrorhizon]|uniref:Retrotransposon gag domain-containing protein n=1 Tax=Lithospermum erythrorhizon TaxID=34254 RepID=A0AAV3QVN1_LITER